ncbi:hypothetical protein [Bacillus inaquosorum]|uniref:hypothetical protein n=1 Tax=Bacillus inaquosorum TaxID=483913 RepID=UPI002280C9A6|nr:hypothetical protein [Bacillus inaquosorum]MCY7900362.1 hypothetical protein [Bacillus inaquosorum]MCY8053940.1 hypothetical protein [Bacillus inaquosorum]MCY8260884.1 hypothetical protein [Bacillus inaquosorum]MCY8285925.1 hypothetical protein [Bacillus inaquosorum]MCY9409372.1 hypothetical protein [Bacillus inaquosorum]
MDSEDHFKTAIKSYCKRHNMSSQKARFTKSDGFITISVKNHSGNGIDIDCFKVLDCILNIIGPREIKFRQTSFMLSDTEIVDRVTVSFEEKDYKALIALFSLREQS